MFIPAHYFYLVLTLPFLVVWLVLYNISTSTRAEQLLVSWVGAIAGPLSEIVYVRDYWTPQSIFPLHIGEFTFMIEDVLFGFAITGIAAIIFEVLVRTRLRKVPTKPHTYGPIQIFVVFTFVLSVSELWVNSIYASALAFLVATVPMVLMRRDLFFNAFGSGIGVAVVMFMCYYFLFHITSNIDEAMREGWHLYGTSLDWRIAGIPLTEMVWGFSMGFLVGPLYEFLRNERAT